MFINRKKLERTQAELDRRTADYHGEDIWDLSEFLMLLNLADHDKLGKPKAIIYAYKLGHLTGKQDVLDKIESYLKNSTAGR